MILRSQSQQLKSGWLSEIESSMQLAVPHASPQDESCGAQLPLSWSWGGGGFQGIIKGESLNGIWNESFLFWFVSNFIGV